MNKEILQNHINNNLSLKQISKIEKRSVGSIRHWLNKYNLKTNHKQIGKGFDYKDINYVNRGISSKGNNIKLIKDYNWEEINNYHYAGHGWREITNKYGLSQSSLCNAKKQGLFLSLGMSESIKRIFKRPDKTRPKHSDETKRKISIIRKEFLKNNPDKCVWKRKDKFDSFPCENLKRILKENNIEFVEEYQPLLHLRRYFSIDIAFPEIKVGIEINGTQHYNRDGTLAKYYQDRHNLIESEGWKLYECPYSLYKDNNYMLNLMKEAIK
jgi:hypothetical protein